MSTATLEAPTLPRWLKSAPDLGPGHFLVDCDQLYPELMDDLGITDDDLDQYWLTMLGLFATHDARIADKRSKANDKPGLHLHFKNTQPERFDNKAKEGEPKVRGWIEVSEVEWTPDEPCKKGETIVIDGVPHVCLDEEGCRKMKGGLMESGQFRREVFHARPAGKGVEQAYEDFRQLYRTIRGYEVA